MLSTRSDRPVAPRTRGRHAVLALAALAAIPPARLPAQAPAPLTVHAAAAHALASHPARRGASAAAEEARHAATTAAAARVPSVELSASLQQHQEPMLVQPLHGLTTATTVPFDETLIQGGISLGYTVFDGGARSARIRGARVRAGAADAALDAAGQGVLAAVIASYARALGRAETLGAHDARVAALEKEVARVRRLHDVGRAATVDVLRAEAALATAEAGRIHVAASLTTAEGDLARLAGLEPERTRVERLARIRIRNGDTPLPSRDAQLALGLERSPLVREARSVAAASRTGVDEARSARWPSLSLGAGYVDRGASTGEFKAEWVAGITASYPLFTGGARRGRIDRARAAAAGAAERLRLAEFEVAESLDRAYSAVTEARARTASFASAVARHREVVRIARLALDAGTGTQMDYLDAEADLLAARAGHAESVMAELTGRAELARVTGELSLAWISNTLEETP